MDFEGRYIVGFFFSRGKLMSLSEVYFFFYYFYKMYFIEFLNFIYLYFYFSFTFVLGYKKKKHTWSCFFIWKTQSTHRDKRKRDIGKSKRDIESLLLKKSFIFLASCKSVYLFHWKGQKGFLCEYKYTKNPMHFSISCISGTKV